MGLHRKISCRQVFTTKTSEYFPNKHSFSLLLLYIPDKIINYFNKINTYRGFWPHHMVFISRRRLRSPCWSHPHWHKSLLWQFSLDLENKIISVRVHLLASTTAFWSHHIESHGWEAHKVLKSKKQQHILYIFLMNNVNLKSSVTRPASRIK